MANVLVQQSTMAAIADAIRDKSGSSDTFKPNQMASAIDEISTGIDPDRLEEVSIDVCFPEMLPLSFYFGSAVVYNNEIHIIGSENSDYSNNHYKWNGSEWTSVSILPYSFMRGSAVVYNNEIHLLGDYASDYRRSHYKWNGSSWTNVATLPCEFMFGSAVVYNNEIHIFKGTYHYKWNGSSWTNVSTIPYDFLYGSAVVYNNEIHLLGGNYSSSTYKYHYKWNGSSWTSVSTLPYNFYEGSAVVYNNEIHILGSGYNSSYYTAHYKWNGSAWKRNTVLPCSYYRGSAVVYNNQIHLLGGAGNTINQCILNCNLYKLLPIPTLKITSTPGATITYTVDSTSKSFSYTEEKTIELSTLGTYTIKASLNGEESTKTVNVTARKEYTVDMSAATLAITSDVGASITWNNGVSDKTFVSTGTDTVASFATGTWTVTASLDGNTKSKTVNVSTIGAYTVKVMTSGVKVVPFATATDDELVEIVNAYYDDELTLADIKAVWSVGDTRNVNLSAMGNSGIANSYSVTETHTAQTVQMVIIDFEHDNLATAINGHSKALLTLNQKDCMKLESNSTYQYESSTADAGSGAMNNYTGSHTNVGGWTDCSRRTWCNSSYKNALPATLKSAVKTVQKLTSAGSQSSTINTTNDDVFLLSEIEVFGTTTYSFAGEGSQYAYFGLDASNIYKNPKWSASTQNSATWWERSPLSSSSSYFCFVNGSGSARSGNSGNAYGVAPALCL